jgi:hypothetical protein
MVMLSGAPSCAVDEMTHIVPERTRRTCSLPTREPPMNSVNSALPSIAWVVAVEPWVRGGVRAKADG